MPDKKMMQGKKSDATFVIQTPSTTPTANTDKGKKTVMGKDQKKTSLWQENKPNLMKAGLWAFIEESGKRPWPSEQLIMPFIATMRDDTNLNEMIGGNNVHFDNAAISRVLLVPGEVDSLRVTDLEKLTIDQIKSIFSNGLNARVGMRWSIDSAKQPWKDWFNFVNFQFTFEEQPSELSARALHMAVAAWQGVRVDWASLLSTHMRRILWNTPATLPDNHQLQCYLSQLCQAYERSSGTGPSQPGSTSQASELEEIQAASKRATPKRRRPSSTDEPEKKTIVKRNTKKNQVNLIQDQTIDMATDLQTQVAMEASRATEAEDRLRDLTLHTEQQANLISEQARKIQEHIEIRVAMSHTARRKDEMLEAARRETARTISEFENNIATLTVELQGAQAALAESKRVDTETIVRLQDEISGLRLQLREHEQRMKAAERTTMASPAQIRMEDGQTIDRLYRELSSLKLQLAESQSRETASSKTIDRLQAELASRKKTIDMQGDELARARDETKKMPESLDKLRKELQLTHHELAGQEQTIDQHNRKMRELRQELVNFSAMKDTVAQLKEELEEKRHQLGAAQLQIQAEQETAVQLQRQLEHEKTIVQSVVPTLPQPSYQGNYDALFNNVSDQPILSWEAIAWLLKDYGQSREETIPADVAYRQESKYWSRNPPPAVKDDPRFCACPRRNRWNPAATLDFIEYNWPLIPGMKNTPQQCFDTYTAFWAQHHQCQDPVCYRAAIFCKILAKWCLDFGVWIDVDVRNDGVISHTVDHPEFWLHLKLQYRCSRVNRLLEAMCLTHFIIGAHPTMINEFGYLRKNPIDRFLENQRRTNPQLAATDSAIRGALERIEKRAGAHHRDTYRR